MHSDYNIIYNSTNWKPSIKKIHNRKTFNKNMIWSLSGIACKHYMIIMATSGPMIPEKAATSNSIQNL